MAIHHIEAERPADLLKSSATAVWVFLIVATVVSWTLGTDHGFIDDHCLIVCGIVIGFYLAG